MLHAASLLSQWIFFPVQVLIILVAGWVIPCLLENLRYPWLLASMSMLCSCSRLTSSSWCLMGKLEHEVNFAHSVRCLRCLCPWRLQNWRLGQLVLRISRFAVPIQWRHLCLSSVCLGCSEHYGCVAAVFAEWMKVFVVKCNQVENCSAYKHIWHSMTGH